MIIAHLTSAHPRDDIRIFRKQCASLARAGHEVYLVVADGRGDEVRDDVRILDAGRSRGRRDRMLGATRRVMQRALETPARIFQLHDPELLPVGLALKRRGMTVVFDAHEDLPQQTLTKPYLHPAVRRPIAASLAQFERFACKRLDMVLTATPAIRDKFVRLGVRAHDINNFPLLGELESDLPDVGKEARVCYVGGIAEIRGLRQIVDAIALSAEPTRLSLGGNFWEPPARDELAAAPAWSRVDEHGMLSRAQVRDLLGRSVAGIVTFLPFPNHVDSQPNKMFEYMSASLPVIGSNFPLWREIIEGNDCGLCVDPLDPAAIASAIDHLVANPDVAARMGANGKRAVYDRYNWAAEEKKLIALYDDLAMLPSSRPAPAKLAS